MNISSLQVVLLSVTLDIFLMLDMKSSLLIINVITCLRLDTNGNKLFLLYNSRTGGAFYSKSGKTAIIK